MLATDALLLPLAFWTAVALREGEWAPRFPGFHWLLILAPLIAIPIFVKLGLYRAVIRYMEDKVIIAVLKGVTLSVGALVAVSAMIRIVGVPRSSWLIYWGIALLYIGGSRIMARAYFRRLEMYKHADVQKQVAIYGAGATGVKLAAALRSGAHFNVVAFIDDNPDCHGTEIAGVEVYSPSDISEMLESEGVDTVLLAIPSASRQRRQEIIHRIESHKVSVKTVPSMVELLTGVAKLDEIREVEIEDLLGRDTVQPFDHLLTKCISGKVVMVTGAGGSIGSELCRQIILQKPTRLVLFERTEFALYQIEQELSAIKMENCEVEIIPILGSVTDGQRVETVLRAFSVQSIYHAAAYKHVPLVEHNTIEGVINNVFGTLRTAEAAKLVGVETFVLISTDKAVRPTNVMGATKRFAELVLQALASKGGGTRFCMVRFGNVLGSSGSVVPLFRKQIQNGGPVTVTHPEITRYFMTIPEAANLVLQAGSMGLGGDVFVLDMGSPVKIVDLAHRMIHLSGLEVRDEAHPDGDIKIEYTGLRPGEKLYEELLIGENVSGTEHPLIMRAQERELPWDELCELLAQIEVACEQFDCEKVRASLLEVVDGYQPSGGIEDYVWRQAAAQVH